MSNRKIDNRNLNIVSKLIDNIKNIIFYLILGIVVITFIYDRIIGIWLAGSFFIIYLVSYLITLSSKRKLLKIMQEYSIISDVDVAEKLNRPVEDIRKTLYSLAKNQKKRKWYQNQLPLCFFR